MLLSLLLGCGLTATAQRPTAVLAGQILDAKTGQPLPFATVYINNTSQGISADDKGIYRLVAVPLGNQELVASVVGYQTKRLPIRLIDSRINTINLQLEPAEQALAGVTVTARHNRAWVRQAATFSRELLGNRPQARQCQITNPNVLSFTDEVGHFRAKASEPLIIDNAALGYRIYYNLLYFDLFRGKMQFAGTSRFEELPANDSRQKARWVANRVAAYQGSLQHLLASLAAGTHEQAGYQLYQTPLTNDGSDGLMPTVRTQERQYVTPEIAAGLIKAGGLSFERELVSSQPLEVYYDRVYQRNSPYHDSPYAYSMLLLPTGRVDMTTNGWITQGNGLDVRGYLGNDRLATQLPADWMPPTSDLLINNSVVEGRVAKPDAVLDSLVRLRKRNYLRTAPAVYLHTDKSFYVTGDRLWLTAYLLDAARQLPQTGLPGSALLVELIAPSGEAVQHQWLSLTGGVGGGSFRIGDKITSGLYRLRASTSLDAGPDQPAFECQLPIYTTSSLPTTADSSGLLTATGNPRKADSLVVTLMPEGGHWLAGVPSRLGIKTVSSDGYGRAVQGQIMNQTGEEVTRFSTDKQGIGQVALTPSPGQQYRAIIGQATHQQVVALPQVETEGWSLAADVLADSSRMAVRIQATGRASQQPLYVTLQCREQLVYCQKWLLQKGQAQFSLSTVTLPPGVCRLMIWDTSRHVRAERLLYIPYRNGVVQMRVTLGKSNYAARQPVGIGFQLLDANGYPVAAMWSAAVTDADQVPEDASQVDLRTYMFLTEGLQDRVEKPETYLDPNHAALLDSMLLTNHWRRQPFTAPVDSTGGWTLRGDARDQKGQFLPQKQVVLVLEQGNEKMMRTLETDEKGRFSLSGLQVADTLRAHYRVLGDKVAGARITFGSPGSSLKLPAFSPGHWQPQRAELAQARTRQLAWPAYYRDSTARQLAEVVVRAQRLPDERPDDVKRSSIYGEPDASFVVDLLKQPALNGLLVGEILNRLPGVQISGGGVRVHGFSSFGDSTPLFLVDGVNIDAYTAMNIPLNLVSRIELLKNASAAIYGARGAAGVIAIYTRKSNGLPQLSAMNKSETAILQGFAPAQSYVPPTELPGGAEAADRRDVLYWQPLGKSEADGLGRLNFPLNDVARRVRVVVQGITAEGVPIYGDWILPLR